MKRILTITGLLAVLVAASSGAFALEGGALSSQARITLDQARAAALAAQPGTVLDQELEHRKGGSGLRYSFDVKVGTTTHEVGVDAADGTVLQNTAEGVR